MALKNLVLSYNKKLAVTTEYLRQLTLIRGELEKVKTEHVLWSQNLTARKEEAREAKQVLDALDRFCAELTAEFERTKDPLTESKQKTACVSFYKQTNEVKVKNSAVADIERELDAINQRLTNLTNFGEVAECELIKKLESLKIDLIMIERKTGFYYNSNKIDNMVKIAEDGSSKFVGDISDLELIYVPTEDNSEKE